MRILINTVCFYPNIGGLETINMLLAEGLSKRGHDVILFAPDYKESYNDAQFDFRIIRNGSAMQLLKAYLWCDIFLHSPISLKAIWPIFIWPFRPWICVHHTCCFYNGLKPTVQSRLKCFFSKISYNIAVSNSVANYLNLSKPHVIYNAYNSSTFKVLNKENRTGFVYVGRLVSEKGVMLLLKAFNNLYYYNRNSIHAHLTIVGDGEDKQMLSKFVEENGLAEVVQFKGYLKGQNLVDEINGHFCQVIPSVYNEAFGIVALEAMASGCIALISDGDGLAEAVGDNGLTFKKGSVDDLAKQMENVASISVSKAEEMRKRALDWCKNFEPERIVKQYEDYFIDILNK